MSRYWNCPWIMTDQPKHVYVSYSRRSDYSFIQKLLSVIGNEACLRSLVVPKEDQGRMETLADNPPNNIDLDQWQLIYDENGLPAFGSIQGFMDELSEGERIIILLSPGYFQSPYCLTELCLNYSKRAHELIPVVAFVDGYQPSQVSIDSLIGYWKKKQTKAEKKNKQAKANCCGEFICLLPKVLAWLL